MNEHPPFHALIVAAGRGERADLALPKQFADLGGKSVLRWSAEAITAHPACISLTVVVAPDAAARTMAAAALDGLDAVLINGGAERQQSVQAGLNALDDRAALVLVHDAARPGLDSAVIDRLLAAFAEPGQAGAVPVLPVADTLARSSNGLGETVGRHGLMRVQTPQAFRLATLRDALAAWDQDPATDETQVVRAHGSPIALVEGSRLLDKITLPGDLAHMALLLGAERDEAVASRRSAVATGFDVHRLIAGDGVWLGGVLVPGPWALEGHSDADVLLHAITDALLGCICAGDIGQHFPPSDPQWRGAASDRFLIHAASLVNQKGGNIEHVDATIICEVPKVGQHRDAIRANVATILGLPLDHISIKATTTERLGFTGRGEGVAAQATVTVSLPSPPRITP